MINQESEEKYGGGHGGMNSGAMINGGSLLRGHVSINVDEDE